MAETQRRFADHARSGARRLRWLARELRARAGREREEERSEHGPRNHEVIAGHLRLVAADVGAFGFEGAADPLMQMANGLEVLANVEPFSPLTPDEQGELAATFGRYADAIDSLVDRAPAPPVPGGAA